MLAVLRCSCTAADDVVFRAVRQNNGCTVGQLDCGGCCGSHRNAFERKSFGGVIPCRVLRSVFGAVQQCYCLRAAVRGGEVRRFVHKLRPLGSQRNIFCYRVGEVIRRIAAEPADKHIAVLSRVVRLCCRSTAPQDLLGVVRAVDLIGHGVAVNVIAAVAGELAVEDCAAGHAFIHGDRYGIIGVQLSPDGTAVGVECGTEHIHICLNIRISADEHGYSGKTLHKYGLLAITVIRNDRAVEGKPGAAGMIYRSTVEGKAVPDRAAVHVELTIAADTATAPAGSRTIPDRTTVHGEPAAVAYVHTAAISRIGDAATDSSAVIHLECAAVSHIHTTAVVVGRAADDAAAVHGEPAAGINVYTAAFAGLAAVDDAAEDGLVAVAGNFLPQALGIGVKLMHCSEVGVLQRQVAAGCDLEHTVAAGHFQHIAVEVKCDGAVNGEGSADGNVVSQLDDVHGIVRQGGGQFLFRSNLFGCLALGKYACRHNAEHHTKGEQDAE